MIWLITIADFSSRKLSRKISSSNRAAANGFRKAYMQKYVLNDTAIA